MQTKFIKFKGGFFANGDHAIISTKSRVYTRDLSKSLGGYKFGKRFRGDFIIVNLRLGTVVWIEHPES